MDLSIVIPVTSLRDTYRRCLASVVKSYLNVKLKRFEIEIIVKNSTGQKLERDYWSAKFVDDRPREMYDSWNECVRISKGQFIHIMHDDDTVRPDFYQLVSLFLKRDMFGGICTGYEVVESDGIISFENRISRNGASLSYTHLLKGNPLVPSCVVISRDFYVESGCYGPEGCLDWELYLRLANWRLPCGVIPELLVRQHRGTESQEGRDGRALTCRKIVETIKEWEYKHVGQRMPARDNYLQRFVSEAVRDGDVELFKAALELR